MILSEPCDWQNDRRANSSWGRIICGQYYGDLVTMVDRTEIAEDWSARGFGCDLWVDRPGARWEGFTHATDELVIVLEGRMEFEVEGQVVHPKAGEELLIPAGAVHSARNIGDTTARWLYGYQMRS